LAGAGVGDIKDSEEPKSAEGDISFEEFAEREVVSVGCGLYTGVAVFMVHADKLILYANKLSKMINL
jgi:hypothetical protein